MCPPNRAAAAAVAGQTWSRGRRWLRGGFLHCQAAFFPVVQPVPQRRMPAYVRSAQNVVLRVDLREQARRRKTTEGPRVYAGRGKTASRCYTTRCREQLYMHTYDTINGGSDRNIDPNFNRGETAKKPPRRVPKG